MAVVLSLRPREAVRNLDVTEVLIIVEPHPLPVEGGQGLYRGQRDRNFATRMMPAP